MTRVLMTADTLGGVWTYALELAAGLGGHGVEVTLATMGRAPSPAQARAAAALPNLELHASSYRLEWMPEPWADVDDAGAWLLDLERRAGADVVQINGYAHAALPFRAPVVAVVHSCVCSWWRAVHGEDAPATWAEYRRRVAAGLAAAAAVVAPTAAILDDVLAAHEVPGAITAHVIPNAREVDVPPAERAPLVLAAGRLWDPAKNLAALDRCAPRIRWPIAVAGPVEHPGGGADATPRAVRLLGELAPDELLAWMARAEIYALPARYEPFGLSVVEAALAGCALVLGDIASLREVWEDDAVFVAPDDDAALAAAIEDLVADARRRRALAARARARAATLTRAAMAARYLDVYRSVAAPAMELSA